MISKSLSKFIKSLKIKKYRLKEKTFLIEGRKNIIEAIKGQFSLNYLLATPEVLLELNKLGLPADTMIFESTPEELESLGTFQHNADCLAVAPMPSALSLDFSQAKDIFFLDGVSDPGNLGTIIRTLDWFGFDQVFCSLDTADCYNPKVINATMGSFTRVRVGYVDLEAEFKATERQLFGADLSGIPLTNWKPEKPAAIVMGSESHGLRPEVQALLTDRISIAGGGAAESLNVGIAAGIIAHHLFQFRTA